MADKLEWINKHPVLLAYQTVAEAGSKENYKIRPDLEQEIAPTDSSEKCLQKLGEAKKWKDACEYMAYAMHKRAAVWWGYCCVLSLFEELEQSPMQERDIADIGKPAPHNIPDWAKNDTPDKIMGKEAVDDAFKEAKAMIENAKKMIPHEIQSRFDSVLNEVFGQFKKQYGIAPMDLLQKAIDSYNPDVALVNEAASPMRKAEKELKDRIEKMRLETVALIKSALPPKMPEHVKKLKEEAMNAVYSWVVAPDEVNSKKALDVGNSCPDTPAGLLSLVAFWSLGNLNPTGERFVPTPPGLAANGLNSVLLTCSLHQGGTRKFNERFKVYFDIGMNTLYGKNNWGESLEERIAPHNKIVLKNNEKTEKNENKTYSRFKDDSVL